MCIWHNYINDTISTHTHSTSINLNLRLQRVSERVRQRHDVSVIKVNFEIAIDKWWNVCEPKKMTYNFQMASKIVIVEQVSPYEF